MTDDNGLWLSSDGVSDTLHYNNQEVHTTRGKGNSFGLYASGAKLMLGGKMIALSPEERAVLDKGGDDVYLNDILLTSSGRCVNITLANYNLLRRGKTVEGYECYELGTIYNIVDNVGTAHDITYTVDTSTGIVTFTDATEGVVTGMVESGDDVLYNNRYTLVEGAMTSVLNANSSNPVAELNTVDTTAEDPSLVTNDASPQIAIRYFSPYLDINSSNTIEIEYYVDDKNMSSVHNGTLGDTFTVIVTLFDGTDNPPQTSRTTYAGNFKLVTPEFTTTGVQWFSVKVIDSNGVGSVEQLYDVLVTDSSVPAEDNGVFVMEDNTTWETVGDESGFGFDYDYDGDNIAEHYRVVPNDDTPLVGAKNKVALSALFAKAKAGNYSGIRMYNNQADNNGAGTKYWIDYHAVDGFGEVHFYKCKVSVQTITEIAQELTLAEMKNIGKWPYVFSTTVTTPVVGDIYGIRGTIYVKYSSSYYKCTVTTDGQITAVSSINAGDIPRSGIIQTWDHVPTTSDTFDTTEITVYLVTNTSKTGDDMVFPNWFTVDLNKSTIAVIPCVDIYNADAINFYKNEGTHLINGSVYGFLEHEDCDYRGGQLSTGNSIEFLRLLQMEGSHYCSFENLDIRYAVGSCCKCENVSPNSVIIGYHPSLSHILFNDNTSIDLETGEEINYYPEGTTIPEGATSNNAAYYKVCSDYFAYNGQTYNVIAFYKGGYANYLNSGPERINIFCFYDYDDENQEYIYLGYAKSSPFNFVHVPSNTKYIRMVGYGKHHIEDTVEDTDWTATSYLGNLRMARNFFINRNIEIKGCSFFKTHEDALGNQVCRGLLIENCTFKDIAVGGDDSSSLVPVLMDIEDNGPWASDICIRGCETLEYTDSSLGSKALCIYYAKNVDIHDNDGLIVDDEGGIASGFIQDNVSSATQIYRNRSCYFPFVVWRDNTMNTLSINYGKWKYKTVTFTHHTPEHIVAMQGTTIINHCGYADLKLRNSVMDGEGY